MYAHSEREIIYYYNYDITTTSLLKNQLTEDQRSHLLTLLCQLAFSENMKNSHAQNFLQKIGQDVLR